MTTDTKVVSAVELEAVVIRADGSREELGTLAYWYRNPLRRLWARVMGKGRISLG